MSTSAEFARRIDDEEEPITGKAVPRILYLVVDNTGSRSGRVGADAMITDYKHLTGQLTLEATRDSAGAAIFGELPDPNEADSYLAHEGLGPDYFDEP